MLFQKDGFRARRWLPVLLTRRSKPPALTTAAVERTAMSEHHRKLERMYHEHPSINDFFEPEMTVSEGAATIDLPISEKLHHPAGAAHGTAYFKALDDAAFFAANSLVEDVFLLTTQMNLYLTRPISEGTMHARGEVLHERPGQYIAESVIEDDDGNQLARATATFVPSEIELDAEIGYE